MPAKKNRYDGERINLADNIVLFVENSLLLSFAQTTLHFLNVRIIFKIMVFIAW